MRRRASRAECNDEEWSLAEELAGPLHRARAKRDLPEAGDGPDRAVRTLQGFDEQLLRRCVSPCRQMPLGRRKQTGYVHPMLIRSPFTRTSPRASTMVTCERRLITCEAS